MTLSPTVPTEPPSNHSHDNHNNDYDNGSNLDDTDSTNDSCDEEIVYTDDESDAEYKRPYADGTRKTVGGQKHKWIMFCKTHKLDPYHTLKVNSPSTYKKYLRWRLKTGRVKAYSALDTYWKQLCMLYSSTINSWNDPAVHYQVNCYIHYLAEKHQLRTEEKVKSALYVQDLAILLNYHWIRDTEVFSHERLRLQLAAMLILSGPTSSRPTAISRIKYKDITFALFPSQEGRPYLTMRVRLTETKTRGGKKQPAAFGFHEEANFAYCPVTAVLALAIADNAFLPDISNLSQIYSLRIGGAEDRRTLYWKEDWKEQYVFRKMDSPSSVAPYQYGQAYHAFTRLGRSCGYAYVLNFYDIRRASGKRLNEVVTPEERNQIMGHSGGGSEVFRRFYLPHFVDRDVQAIYFGTTAQDTLIRQMSRIPRNGLAPTRLGSEQKDALKADPALRKAIKKRNQLRVKLRDRYGTVKAARELGRSTDVSCLKKYDKAAKLVSNTRAKLHRHGIASVIETFHQQSGPEEIRRQLEGLYPDPAPPKIEVAYELPEREEVAEILLNWSEGLGCDELDRLRVRFVSALSNLCHRQESTHHYRKTSRVADKPALGTPRVGDEAGMDDRIQVCPPVLSSAEGPKETLACAFCQSDPASGHFKQARTYARIDSLGHHIFKQHFHAGGQPRTHLAGSPDAFHCPYNDCLKVLYGARDFAHHAHLLHGTPKFQEASIPGPASTWSDILV
ncbi:hypothetical protein NUW58_g6135 [Xylaria curta]|uniref:Uncharacterized protein n=1 Tax=Xylaria curta TaxID=42375 RepID=A0ACC1P0S2_9PEZI|nr:hypothetical protein NUW58_g6135 [Xylaria curta]